MKKHNITIIEEATINAKGKKNSNHTTPVVGWRVDGSEVVEFSSIEDAAATIKANKSYLGQCIIHERRCKGWRFCKAKDVATYFSEIVGAVRYNTVNKEKDAEDAAKWREQEKAKEAARKAEEKRLAEIVKAEERARKEKAKKQKAIERLQTKIKRSLDKESNIWNKYYETIEETDKYKKELEALINEMEMEEVA